MSSRLCATILSILLLTPLARAEEGSAPGTPTETPPVSGFPVERGAVGVRLEVGFPFLDLQLAYGAHDRVEIGLGYRGLYFHTNAPYASLNVLLYRTPSGSAVASLNLRGGYTIVQDGEGHDRPTSLVGGDSGFGELSIAISAGRYRHSFVATLGLRLAWVREQPRIEWEETDYYGSQYLGRIFESGEAGLLPSPFFEVGYAGRVSRNVSLFLTTGLTASMTSDLFEAMVRARAGLALDFHRRPGR